MNEQTIGEEILLKWEPTNPCDSNAIRVEDQNGEQIDFVNRYLAAILAPFFDANLYLVSGSTHSLTGSSRRAILWV